MRDLPSYEFGPFRLIPAERLLLRRDEPIALTPKAFDTLVALVRRAGRLADKETLLNEVWPDSFVEESNLTQAVFAIRRALGPAEGDKPYIETVPKRGYRFVEAVKVIDPAGAAQAPGPETTETTGPPPAPAPPAGWTRSAKRAVALLGVAAVLGAAALFVSARRGPSSRAFDTMEMVRLTTSGNTFNVAISPDGKYVAHASRENGAQSLWVRQIATQSLVRIAAPANVAYVGLTFSPDSNYVYYNVSSDGGARRTLFRVASLGGPPTRVLENLRGGSVAVSPDGRQLAFIRVTPGQSSSLIIAGADGTDERTLATHPHPLEELDAPAWSPDGRRVAYALFSRDRNDSAIVEARVDNGDRRPVSSRRWLRIIKLAWLADGSGLVLLATPGDSFVYQIWRVGYPDGTAARITNDLNSYGSMSLAADVDVLAAVTASTQANIWVAPDGDVTRLRPVTTGGGKVDTPTAWTPDGRIVYHSTVSGEYDIWSVDAGGGAPRQLTRDARVNQGPAVSPDGRTIVFLSDRTGAPHLWRMNVDGSNPRQLTDGPYGEQNPQFSPDGRWIVYRTASGIPTVWKIPAAGGEAVRLTDTASFVPSVSPDGRWLAYLVQDQNAPPRIAVAPFEGGTPVTTLPFSVSSPLQRLLRWTPDGRALAYIDTIDGASNIVAQPIDGGARVRLTHFTDGRLFGFAWSSDGRHLAVARGATTSDIVLIKHFR